MGKKVKIKLQGSSKFLDAVYHAPKKKFFSQDIKAWRIYKLTDGRQIMTEKLAAGSPILIKDSAGSPLGDGTHELTDGTKIIVVVGSIISKVIPKK